MTTARRKGEKIKYAILDRRCLGCICFQPGPYYHRGATMSGSRNTGDVSMCCLRRAYHGCPTERVADATLLAQRKADGWRAIE